MGMMRTLTINGTKYDVVPVVPAASITLLANAWVGNGDVYSQVVEVPDVTPHTKVDLQPTSEQLSEFHYKVLAFVAENNDGVVTVYSVGDKPTGDHTIQITKTEVQGTSPIRGNTVGTTMPRPDWNQTDPTEADYIRNKPDLVGVRTAEGGEIFNFYTDPVYTGDNPPKEYPGNTAAKGSHAEGFGTHADGEYAHAEGWNARAAGGIAHAEGRETLADGYASHAEGQSTLASGGWSHAEGKETKAIGNYTHAEGYKSEAQANYSHAEGYQSIASNTISHAEGRLTEASGTNSHSEGNSTVASGNNSHAEGNATKATGTNSHSEGNKTEANGAASHAEGESSKTEGMYAHAEGYQTLASGVAAHSEGVSTEASGYASHASGRGTKATCRYQSVRGAFNEVDEEAYMDGRGFFADIVGGGTSDSNRFNIYTLDWDGNARFAGKVYADGVDLTVANSKETLSGYSDANNIPENGHYRCNRNTPTNDWGTVTHVVYSQPAGDTHQRFVTVNGLYTAERRQCEGVWDEWEWVNPPMELGVEYRTIERYNGKPVYKQLVSLGNLTNNSTAYALMDSEKFKTTQYFNVISIEPSYEELDANGAVIRRYCGNIPGVTNIYAKQSVIGLAEIYCKTNADMSNYKGYAVVSYTEL